MRLDNDISLREMELGIFGLLSSGCATYPEIKTTLTEMFTERIMPKKESLNFVDLIGDDLFEVKKKSKGNTRLNDESLYKILSLMRKNKLIQSCRYFDRERGRNFTLYANTENSVEVLRESGYWHSHIRSPYLPSKFAYWHDMDLTKVVRTIKRDGPIYYYHYKLWDEFALRRVAEKAKKGDLYPDLKLYIKVKSGEEYFFRIEVQRHRDRVEQFAKKISTNLNNLVLFKDRRLIYDIAETQFYLRDKALFAHVDDFISNGLFEAKWMSSDNQVVGLRYSTG